MANYISLLCHRDRLKERQEDLLQKQGSFDVSMSDGTDNIDVSGLPLTGDFIITNRMSLVLGPTRHQIHASPGKGYAQFQLRQLQVTNILLTWKVL